MPQYKEGKKLKPKPNYNSVDLSEVEWEDTEEKVGNTHTLAQILLIQSRNSVAGRRVCDVCVSAEDGHGQRGNGNAVSGCENDS